MPAVAESPESLRDMIRRHIAAQIDADGSIDAQEVSAHLLKEVGMNPSTLAWICRQTLPGVVREVMGQLRRASNSDLLDIEPPTEDTDEVDSDPPPPGPVNRSAKVIGIRATFGSPWWHKEMEKPFALPGNKRTTLGELTKTGLQYNIELRRKDIHGLEYQNAQLTAMKEALVKHKVRCMKQVPEVVYRDIVGVE